MATNDLKVQVSIEKAIHATLADTLQKMAEEHGVVVESVNTEWVETIGAPPRLLRLMLQTTTQT